MTADTERPAAISVKEQICPASSGQSRARLATPRVEDGLPAYRSEGWRGPKPPILEAYFLNASLTGRERLLRSTGAHRNVWRQLALLHLRASQYQLRLLLDGNYKLC